MIRPYMILAVAIALIATHAGVYLKGHKAGAVAELAKCQAQQIEDAQDASRALEALQQQLREREAQWVQQQQEAADAVAQVRVEYLPGRTIVKREIVERAVFRECRVTPAALDAINGALIGRPVSASTGE